MRRYERPGTISIGPAFTLTPSEEIEQRAGTGGGGGGMTNPMISRGDLIMGDVGGVPVRLPIGPNGLALTVAGGLPTWSTVLTNPMTTLGDLIIGAGGGVPTRLGVGASGLVLKASGSGPVWGPATPITTLGDLVVGGSGGAVVRLPSGAVNQVLTTESGGALVWATPTPGMLNPMTASGDVIVGGASGAPTRLAVGPAGHILMVSGTGAPVWNTPAVTSLLTGVWQWEGTAMTGPPIPSGQIAANGIPPTLLVISLLSFNGIDTSPVLGALIPGDALYIEEEGDISRSLRLAVTGTATLSSGAATVPVRQQSAGAPLVDGARVTMSISLGGGTVNPMTQLGDLVKGGAGGQMTRLAISTDGYVLTAWAGAPEWRSPPAPGMANPMVAVGDLITGGTAGAPTRVAVGGASTVLTSVAGVPTWAALPPTTFPSGVAQSMIVYSAANTPATLAPGPNDTVLTIVGGIPTWSTAPATGPSLPINQPGDLVAGDATGVAVRLPVGAANYVLTATATGGKLVWALPTPITTRGDLIVGDPAGVPMRLGKGATNEVLTVNPSGDLAWGVAGMPNPMTAQGDVIYGGASGVPARLALGSSGHVLTVVSGLPAWQVAPGFANPLAVQGDLMVGGVGGQPARLAIGASAYVLTVAGGTPAWQALPAPGMANPMTAAGDIIRATTGGTPERLAVGTNNQILTVVAGLPAWAANAALSNPMTTTQDLILGGAAGVPTRLGVGTNGQVLTVTAGNVGWATGPGFANPMTQPEDLIKGGVAGAPARLARGSNGQFLSVSANVLVWGGGPMTAVGDLIVGGTAGAPTRLAAGVNGQFLTISGGALGWGTGLSNPMTSIGDLIVGGLSGVATRFGAVATGAVLASAGVGVAPTWNTAPSLAGLTLSGLTPGSVLFAGAGGVITQDNANLFYDNANDNLRLRASAVGTNGQGVFAVGTSTAPTTSPIDTVQLWSEDFAGAAGSHGLEVRDERGGRYSLASFSDGTVYIRAVHPAGPVADVQAGSSFVSYGTYTNYPVRLVQNNTARLTLNTDGSNSLTGRLLVGSDIIQLSNGPVVQMQAYSTIGAMGTTTNHDMLFMQNSGVRLNLSANGGNYFSGSGVRLTNSNYSEMVADGNAAYLILSGTPTGGRDWAFYGIGGSYTGWRGAGSFTLADSVKGEILSWDTNGEWYARVGGYGMRHVIADAPDTGGAGYRRLVVPN
jgi:hypothetical protein